MELQKGAEQPRSLRLGSGLPPHRPEGERGEAEGEPGLDGSRASPKKVVPENAHSISIGAIFLCDSVPFSSTNNGFCKHTQTTIFFCYK